MKRLLVVLVLAGCPAACGSANDAVSPTARADTTNPAATAPVPSEPENGAGGLVEPSSAATAPVNVTVEPLPTSPLQAQPQDDRGDGLFPTVVAVSATAQGDLTWRVDVTLLSEYDSPTRYADAWRVLDGDDNELGIRLLAHDHAGEQPFTRSTSVDIPVTMTTVFIEGRDQLNGWSGERFELVLTSATD